MEQGQIHTHIYIFRERERERERMCVCAYSIFSLSLSPPRLCITGGVFICGFHYLIYIFNYHFYIMHITISASIKYGLYIQCLTLPPQHLICLHSTYNNFSLDIATSLHLPFTLRSPYAGQRVLGVQVQPFLHPALDPCPL